jgi:hypothetical protein
MNFDETVTIAGCHTQLMARMPGEWERLKKILSGEIPSMTSDGYYSISNPLTLLGGEYIYGSIAGKFNS